MVRQCRICKLTDRDYPEALIKISENLFFETSCHCNIWYHLSCILDTPRQTSSREDRPTYLEKWYNTQGQNDHQMITVKQRKLNKIRQYRFGWNCLECRKRYEMSEYGIDLFTSGEYFGNIQSYNGELDEHTRITIEKNRIVFDTVVWYGSVFCCIIWMIIMLFVILYIFVKPNDEQYLMHN